MRGYYQTPPLAKPAATAVPTTTPVTGGTDAERAARKYGKELLNQLQTQQPTIFNQNVGLIRESVPLLGDTARRNDEGDRRGVLQHYTHKGGKYLDALRESNPQLAKLLKQQKRFAKETDTGPLVQLLNQEATNAGPSAISQQLERQALDELELGGQLSADQVRMSDQTARGAWADRGLNFSNPAMIGEVLNRQNSQQVRMRERQGFASGVNAQLLGEEQGDREFQLNVQRGNDTRREARQGAINSATNSHLQADPARWLLNKPTNTDTIFGTERDVLNNASATNSTTVALQDAYQGFLLNQRYSTEQARLNRAAGVTAGNQAGQAADDANDAAMTGAAIAGVALIAAAFICWVAREVYGADNRDWLVFRYWLLTRGSERRQRKYIEHGPAIAAWIATRPAYKARVKRWMDRCVTEQETAWANTEKRHAA